MTTPSDPDCEVLFELFSTPRGRVSLGRLTAGAEVGRIVRLREVLGPAVPRVAEAVAAMKAFIHPQLLKVLGLVTDGSQTYIASEYLPGVSLFELIARARARQSALDTAAAVHVTIASLRLVERAVSLLSEASRPRVRLLHTDSIWIAEFGETLLAEVGVAAYLGNDGAPQNLEVGVDAEQRDVLTAAVELYQLASGQLMSGDLASAVKLHLPAPLAAVLTEVFAWSGTAASDGVTSLATALSALPRQLIGSDTLVAEELRRIALDVLEERERKLADCRSDVDPEIDATRVFGRGAVRDFDMEEPTIEVRRPPMRGFPVTGSPPAARAPALSNAAIPLKMRARRAPYPTPRAGSPRARRPIPIGWLWALALVFIVVAVTAQVRPAWFQRLVHRSSGSR
jgi:hypothetical protein